ncbi:uncharacterized protein LOC134812249 [Bolinopsis microptera]|uniref:uncharacterized protein LOC134812249 n=1 Tax=Bolinopsis microptera TaxID=2820187 RepID=UPI00307AD283
MGDHEGIRVASAFEKDIWFRVTGDQITESSKEKQVGFEASFGCKEASFKADCKTTSKDEAKVTVEAKVEPGFTKLAHLEENTIDPPNSIGLESDKTRVYLTVYYLNKEGNQRYLSENVPYKRGHACIITAKGGIVESLNESDIWLDRNEVNHKTQDRKEKIKTWLKSLRNIADTMGPSDDKDKITLNARKISKKYRKLEVRTDRVIKNVFLYGKEILKAMENLQKVLKNSNKTVKDAIDELEWEMEETKNLKESLEKLREDYPVLVDDLDDFRDSLKLTENKDSINLIDVISSLLSYVPEVSQRISKKAKVHLSPKETLDNIVKELEGIIEDLVDLESKFNITERAKAKAMDLTTDEIVDKLIQRAKELVSVCDRFLME